MKSFESSNCYIQLFVFILYWTLVLLRQLYQYYIYCFVFGWLTSLLFGIYLLVVLWQCKVRMVKAEPMEIPVVSFIYWILLPCLKNTSFLCPFGAITDPTIYYCTIFIKTEPSTLVKVVLEYILLWESISKTLASVCDKFQFYERPARTWTHTKLLYRL